MFHNFVFKEQNSTILWNFIVKTSNTNKPVYNKPIYNVSRKFFLPKTTVLTVFCIQIWTDLSLNSTKLKKIIKIHTKNNNKTIMNSVVFASFYQTSLFLSAVFPWFIHRAKTFQLVFVYSESDMSLPQMLFTISELGRLRGVFGGFAKIQTIMKNLWDSAA